MWFKKVNSEEYERLCKQVSDMRTLISELKGEVIVLEQQIRAVRGIVNRKLYKEDTTEEPKDLNARVLLPYNGTFQ